MTSAVLPALRAVALGAQHSHGALVLHGAAASPERGPSPVRAARRGPRAGGGFVRGETLCGLEPHSQLLMLCLLFRPVSLYQEVIL